MYAEYIERNRHGANETCSPLLWIHQVDEIHPLVACLPASLTTASIIRSRDGPYPYSPYSLNRPHERYDLRRKFCPSTRN